MLIKKLSMKKLKWEENFESRGAVKSIKFSGLVAEEKVDNLLNVMRELTAKILVAGDKTKKGTQAHANLLSLYDPSEGSSSWTKGLLLELRKNHTETQNYYIKKQTMANDEVLSSLISTTPLSPSSHRSNSLNDIRSDSSPNSESKSSIPPSPNSARPEITQLQSENEKLHAQIAAYDEIMVEADKTAGEYDQLQAVVAELQAEVESKKSEIKSLNGSLRRLKETKDEEVKDAKLKAEGPIRFVQAQNLELKEKNKDLQAQFDEMKKI